MFFFFLDYFSFSVPERNWEAHLEKCGVYIKIFVSWYYNNLIILLLDINLI